MATQSDNSIMSFLDSCSHNSLADFFLSRMNKDAELKKQLTGVLNQLGVVLDQAIENRALLELAGLLRGRGGPAPRLGPLQLKRLKVLRRDYSKAIRVASKRT